MNDFSVADVDLAPLMYMKCIAAVPGSTQCNVTKVFLTCS
jgi:hypothetical protein